MAITGLTVAIALYVAVHLLELILPELIVVTVTVGLIYGVVVIVRYRRSRW